MRTEDAQKLANRVKDHLLAQGFRDDIVYPRVTETYDNRVMISLHPHQYDCEACRSRGFVPRLADAFVQRIRPTWCNTCMELTQVRYDRVEQLVPRLFQALATEFTAELSLPDNPFSSVIVTG